MANCVSVAVLLLSLSGCLGQWPLGESFYSSMNQLQRNINQMVANMQINMRSMQNNMAANMQTMRERMARQRQYILDNGIRNVYFSRGYGPGFNRITTSNGGNGYVYNSPDGSVSMVSYSSGPQTSGYVYHSGPDGSYYRRW